MGYNWCSQNPPQTSKMESSAAVVKAYQKHGTQDSGMGPETQDP